MDPLLDEILAADAIAAEVAARLAKLVRLLHYAGGRRRARGQECDGGEFDRMHGTAVRLLRDAEALGRRLRPLAADAEREAGCAAG